MRKTASLILIIIGLLFLAACGSTGTAAQSETIPSPPEVSAVTEPAVPRSEVSETALQDFTTFLEVGVPYPYTTGTYNGGTLATTAEVIVTGYEVFDSAEGYPAKEGYEWRIVKMEVRYYDENAELYGCDISAVFDDYYNTKLCNDQSSIPEQTQDYVLYKYPIVWNEQQMEAFCYWNQHRWGEWYANEEHHVELICYEQWDFLVPAGYDGCIAGLCDSRLEWADGTYITDYSPDQFLLFRAF